jgi:hypothetical protein
MEFIFLAGTDALNRFIAFFLWKLNPNSIDRLKLPVFSDTRFDKLPSIVYHFSKRSKTILSMDFFYQAMLLFILVGYLLY